MSVEAAPAPAPTVGESRVWLGLDVVALVTTALLALAQGTFGYVVIGFAVLTGCTDEAGARLGDTACRPAELWLGAGAVGQGAVVLTALVLLVVAVVRPAARRRVLWLAVGGAVVSLLWTALTSVAAAAA